MRYPTSTLQYAHIVRPARQDLAKKQHGNTGSTNRAQAAMIPCIRTCFDQQTIDPTKPIACPNQNINSPYLGLMTAAVPSGIGLQSKVVHNNLVLHLKKTIKKLISSTRITIYLSSKSRTTHCCDSAESKSIQRRNDRSNCTQKLH